MGWFAVSDAYSEIHSFKIILHMEQALLPVYSNSNLSMLSHLHHCRLPSVSGFMFLEEITYFLKAEL